MGRAGEPVLRYLSDLRGARLEVTGDDLVAAGVPESPAVGRALEETLRRKLDGEVSGREDELALDLARVRRRRVIDARSCPVEWRRSRHGSAA